MYNLITVLSVYTVFGIYDIILYTATVVYLV